MPAPLKLLYPMPQLLDAPAILCAVGKRTLVLLVKAPDLFLLLLPELDSLLWLEVLVLDEAQVPLLLGCLLMGLLGCCWLLSCWITCGCCIRCRLTSSMVGWACSVPHMTAASRWHWKRPGGRLLAALGWLAPGASRH